MEAKEYEKLSGYVLYRCIDKHVGGAVALYLGAINLLGWKVGEKHYRLKGTLSNLKIWRYTHENY